MGRGNYWSRLLPLLIAAAVFAGVFLAAPRLTGNMRIGSISNRTVHKVGHVLVYGGMAVLLAHGLAGRVMPAGLIVLAVSSAAEAQQLFIPGRCARVNDLLLNGLAIVAALALCRAGQAAWRWAAVAPAEAVAG